MGKEATGPAVGVNPSMGGLRGGIWGLERTAPLGKVGWSLVNEGPVAPEFLENTMNLTAKPFNPIGQIVFNAPTVEPLTPEDASRAVEEAQFIISQLKQAVVQSVAAPVEQTIIQPVILPDPKVGQETVRRMGLSRPASVLPELKPKTAYKTMIAPLPKTEVREEILKEAEVEAEEPTKRIVEVSDQGQEDRHRLRIVADKDKTEHRRVGLDQAIEEAAAEAESQGIEGVEGVRIISKLVAKDADKRSETLNQEDPSYVVRDGLWEETKAEIKMRKFTSKDQAKAFSFAFNAKNRPEKWGEGEPITEQEHHQIHKEHGHSKVKLTALEIASKRNARKQLVRSLRNGHNLLPVISTETEDTKRVESSVEDYPDLAEVFQKAA